MGITLFPECSIIEGAELLGINPFSLAFRVQAGDIPSRRSETGEFLISLGEVESFSTVAHRVQSETYMGSDQSGLKPLKRGLKRHGTRELVYSVPGYEGNLTTAESHVYRKAFEPIADLVNSLARLRAQLGTPSLVIPVPKDSLEVEEIHWNIRATLLNLRFSDIILCQGESGFALIERFKSMQTLGCSRSCFHFLAKGADADLLRENFKENARHALAFMASNAVCKAQQVAWEAFPIVNPSRVVAAISERCQRAITTDRQHTNHTSVKPTRGQRV